MIVRYAILALLLSLLFSPSQAAAQTASKSAQFTWAAETTGDLTEVALAAATLDGDAIVAGYFTGKANFGAADLTPRGNMDMFVARYGTDGSLKWVAQAGGKTSSSVGIAEQARAVTVTPDGGILVLSAPFVRVFGDPSRTFGSTTISGWGAVLARYDADGEFLWARQLDAEGNTLGLGLAVDASGSILVTGQFTGTATIGSDILTAKAQGGVFSDPDFFVARLDAAGNPVWARAAGNSATTERGYGVAVGADGGVYVVGNAGAGTAFGSFTKGRSGYFLARYDADGNVTWLREAAPQSQLMAALVEGHAIAADSNGDIVVTGGFGLNLDMNGGAVTDFSGTEVSNLGDLDIFVARYSAAGDLLWIRTGGGKMWDKGYALALDAAGNAYVTGNIYGSAVFEGVWITGEGDCDVFVAAYDRDGALRWARAAGSPTGGGDYGWAISVGAPDEVYVTGIFGGKAHFGRTRVEATTNEGDMYVARLAPSENDGRVWRPLNQGLTLGNRLSNPSFAPFLPFTTPEYGSVEVHNGRLYASLLWGQGIEGPLSEGGIFTLEESGWTYSGLIDGEIYISALTSSGNVLFAQGNRTAYRSTDDGATWTPVVVDGDALLGFEVHGGVIYASGNNGLYKSTDNGETWTVTGPFGALVQAAGDVLFTLDMISHDNGANWTRIAELPGDDFNRTMVSAVLEVDGALLAATGYVGFTNSNAGIFRSMDGGRTWSLSSEGLPTNWLSKKYEPVQVLLRDGETIYAGTGGGLYVSTDAGLTWQPSVDDFPIEEIVDVAIHDGTLYAATRTNGLWYRSLSSSGVAAEGPLAELPASTGLAQNYPNPFNPATVIPFTLSQPAHATLTVHDLLGRRVATLVDGPLGAGAHEVAFDAGDLPSGTYLYRLQTGSALRTGKMTLLR